MSPVAAEVRINDDAYVPETVTVEQGEGVGWRFMGEDTHTVTDRSGVYAGRFDSGVRARGERYSYTFISAGTFPYYCQVRGPSMQGTVQVPVLVSRLRNSYKVEWAWAPAAPGFVYDVQIKSPGSERFVDWRIGEVDRSSKFTPDNGSGAYGFRARLRNTHNRESSRWSPTAWIHTSNQ